MEKKIIDRDPNPLHLVNDYDFLSAVFCSGFRDKFLTNTLSSFGNKEIVKINGAHGIVKSATIESKAGDDMCHVHLVHDRDNRGVIVTNSLNNQIISKAIFRDTHFDGKLKATPPDYLRAINNIPEDMIPPESKDVGFTSWSYSNPGDVPEKDVKAVEISIVSSDPEHALLERLLKKNRLFVDPINLATFIDDPFAYIPFDKMNEETINAWWKYWFQVTDRGLRGKAIPQPGQTSQKGFEGFFCNVIGVAETIAKKAGYTHLTAVPTWTYVWHSFIENGFVPIDSVQDSETRDFLEKISSIELLDGQKLSTLSPKHPLASWLAVAPFVLEFNPDYVPFLGIDEVREERFQTIFNRLKNAVQSGNTIQTYPLSPGRNLWLSKKL